VGSKKKLEIEIYSSDRSIASSEEVISNRERKDN
jgi:hypothetical protein